MTKLNVPNWVTNPPNVASYLIRNQLFKVVGQTEPFDHMIDFGERGPINKGKYATYEN